ncbi:MAG: prepilin-type N-terminal cleavage/methylation domain-containing protein [Thermus sp.]|uniref:Prepilin-type N-terminal cleavage/methylation domain-containing protein n=1 Tax=Thermus brevis TaxID=2862456 RepID=A0ABS6ZXQ3_9DEIN|nr:prepilin-type N-terminal cleavage/methylation domain-containing protein [Thermus brevis]MBW6394842.1 prepilin-type N-terminal cleavage/methylation domain-containing protein [Thermus brevis]
MKAKGFTLIELAIVIVIIGILVAIAVPRFVDLTGQANQANVDATAASVRSAYAIATVQAKGVPTCDQILGNLDGGTVSGTTWTSADKKTTVSCDADKDTLTISRTGGPSVTLNYNIQ